MIHELKCHPQYFARLADGSKTFEIRRNDRGYQAGDELLLRIWDPDRPNHECTDPNCRENWKRDAAPLLRFRVGFVASGTSFGLALGEHVILSLLPIEGAGAAS